MMASAQTAPTKALATILLVEDEVLIRLMAANELRKAGFTVIEAAHAREALSVLRSATRVDVLITDIRMPGPIDGVQLATLARELWPNLKIAIASAYAPQWPNVNVIDAFFGKPYNPDSMIERIKELLQGIK
jgi:two-component system, response regulator PdtaR